MFVAANKVIVMTILAFSRCFSWGNLQCLAVEEFNEWNLRSWSKPQLLTPHSGGCRSGRRLCRSVGVKARLSWCDFEISSVSQISVVPPFCSNIHDTLRWPSHRTSACLPSSRCGLLMLFLLCSVLKVLGPDWLSPAFCDPVENLTSRDSGC